MLSYAITTQYSFVLFDPTGSSVTITPAALMYTPQLGTTLVLQASSADGSRRRGVDRPWTKVCRVLNKFVTWR